LSVLKLLIKFLLNFYDLLRLRKKKKKKRKRDKVVVNIPLLGGMFCKEFFNY